MAKGILDDVDWLGVVVDRADVESGDISSTADVLSQVLANRKTIERFRGRVDLSFHGYSNDNRELYEIPEVRRFVAKLDDAFPHWFYFLSTENATLAVVASCLCSVTKLRPGTIRYGADLAEFLGRHFDALNWLFETYALDERDNAAISESIIKYFSGL